MFIDDLLLDFLAYGFRGGPTWQTTRVRLRSGRERRNAERSRPIYRFRAGYDRIKPEHFNRVVSAYNACLGPVHSFRFKDRADFTLTDQVIGTADGTTDQQLQIVKTYGFGSETLSRVITKPADASKYSIANGYEADTAALVVKADGVPISFSCDYLTGIVTLTATAGQAITVSGEFHVPVHFDDDQLEFDYTTFKAHSTEVSLVEDIGV